MCVLRSTGSVMFPEVQNRRQPVYLSEPAGDPTAVIKRQHNGITAATAIVPHLTTSSRSRCVHNSQSDREKTWTARERAKYGIKA